MPKKTRKPPPPRSNNPNRRPPTPPKGYKHDSARRTNAPTTETSRFLDEEARRAEDYKPDLREAEAPRLAWQRKKSDQPLRSAGPLYIHEKVDPGAFVRQLSSRESAGAARLLFNDLPPEAKYEAYQHKGAWQNRLIHGDSAQVMASLAQKDQLAGKVQMVFFDPPYGIAFKSTMQVDSRKRAAAGKESASVSSEPEMVAAFRDTYKRGIHDYLDAIRENLILARALLADSGSLFLQMGAENTHRLAVVLDEVFGVENRVATIPFKKSGGTSASMLPEVYDYLLWYAKDKERAAGKYHQLFEQLDRRGVVKHMNWDAMVELADGTTRPLTPVEREDPDAQLPDGSRLYRRMPLTSLHESKTGRSESFNWKGREWHCPQGEQWRVSMKGLQRLAELGRLNATEGASSRLRWKRYENEVPGRQISNAWAETMSPNDLHYVVETAESVLERCILMATDPGDLVLDITCGSGTTAFVAEKWGRRWITSDASRIPIALTRQRILSGVHDWFVLQRSNEGAKLEAKYAGSAEVTAGSENAADPAAGFVCERVPYVSAAHLAYDRPPKSTLLVDRPHKAKGIKRISSAFTVESRSPYRVAAPEEYSAAPPSEARENIAGALGTAGLRARDGAHLRLHGLEDFGQHYGGDSEADTGSGRLTHLAQLERIPKGEASTSSADSEEGATVHCAISVLPDDAAASAAWIEAAAHEAAGIPRVEELLVVAFHFESDALVEKPRKFGRLTVSCFRANRDLMIGDLKDTQFDQAFVQIGEPDIAIHEVADGRIEVEILGFDTFDPQTGNLEKGGAKQIDCWMVDTDYDRTAFFATRIHFPGKEGDRQLKRYRRALGPRIADEEWKAMLTTRTTAFPRPAGKGGEPGRIAVRIITTTGVEMTTVRAVKPEK